MASLNVNGLRSHIDDIKLLLGELEIDIIVLNETKLDNSVDCQITDIAGFKQVGNDRSHRGGGVASFVRDSMRFILRNDIPNSNLELLCIEVQPHKSKPFLLIALYRPPNDPITKFYKVEIVLSYLDRKGKEIILMGDTNCDLSKISGAHKIALSDHYLIFCMRKLNASNAGGHRRSEQEIWKNSMRKHFWLMLQAYLGKGLLA